jgi:transglutaminase-like putative cysteine protease
MTPLRASGVWCEAFIPDLGWCSFDPTNNQQADDRYVKLAAGRDYADVAPVKGNYKGTPEKSMSVELTVTALE